MRSSHRRLSGTAITSCVRNITSANNDPRRWGLGTNSIPVPNSDFNKATDAGFYFGSPSDNNGPGWWCSMLSVPRGQDEGVQIAFRINGDEVAVRQQLNEVFGSWKKIAFQTPLGKHTLPGADAFNSLSGYAYYAKDQFGLVTVNIYGIAAQEISAGVDTQIGLLPEGFRPEMQLSSCGWAQTGSAAIVPGAIWVKPNGLINFRSSISVPAGQYIFGQICFLA